MTLVLQILLAIVVLGGLITVIMTVKSWHWAQMLLLLGIFLSSLGTLVLGLEVFRIHRNIRSKLPALEQQVADLDAENEALVKGADSGMASKIFPEVPFDVAAEGRMPSLANWTARLQDIYRARGRVWRGASSAGQVDPNTGRIPVRIDNPKPHGLEKDAIVYLFEEGEPNAASPQDGAQYLGEFRVVETSADGAVLESVFQLDNRTGNRLALSQKPWTIYETMPTDSETLFAGVPEEQLRKWLPESTVEEYIRDGQTVDKPAEFDPHVAMFDEEGHRLGPDDAAKANKWVYSRNLRDYAYLFTAANRELVQLVAERTALVEDAKKLAAAHEVAKKLGALRNEEKQGLTGDLGHMEGDRKAIETHLANVQRILANILRENTAIQAENVQHAAELKAQQQQRLDELDQRAPAPRPSILGTVGP